MKLVLHKNHVNKYNIYNQASSLKQADSDIYFFIPLQEIIHHSKFNCPTNSRTKEDYKIIQSTLRALSV